MDNKNLVAYSKVHEHLLGKLPSADNYEDRIIAQKIGYLVEDAGIHLGDLSFFWHKRGPYSRSLASALRYFEKNREDFEEDCSYVKIHEYVLPRLDFLKGVIAGKPFDCPNIFWLEICASLKYLSKEGRTKDIDYLSNLLIKKKPFLKPYERAMHQSWELLNKVV
ncbi:hypothetical protein [Paenibacillus sp. 276b]|uniref:hypothetical protein n=1 Tax=Paenibacillus sp. 276b TaxID=1566277 RepID=UPI00089C863D|nr:hypothetical protein [Paenibacillus sp. 276b]SEB27991.1 hypothetical protein SAMN03159332_0076 [Paenibacillus sp. 276b]